MVANTRGYDYARTHEVDVSFRLTIREVDGEAERKSDAFLSSRAVIEREVRQALNTCDLLDGVEVYVGLVSRAEMSGVTVDRVSVKDERLDRIESVKGGW